MSAEENTLTTLTLRHMKAGLENQTKIKRLKTSQSITEFMDWVIQNEKQDPMLHPLDKKLNPFIEKGGCYIT